VQIGQTRHPLEVFFAPRSVAVIGASERADSDPLGRQGEDDGHRRIGRGQREQ